MSLLGPQPLVINRLRVGAYMGSRPALFRQIPAWTEIRCVYRCALAQLRDALDRFCQAEKVRVCKRILLTAMTRGLTLAWTSRLSGRGHGSMRSGRLPD